VESPKARLSAEGERDIAPQSRRMGAVSRLGLELPHPSNRKPFTLRCRDAGHSDVAGKRLVSRRCRGAGDGWRRGGRASRWRSAFSFCGQAAPRAVRAARRPGPVHALPAACVYPAIPAIGAFSTIDPVEP
jgi:hypothetical protein